jgi:hypothetical protein
MFETMAQIDSDPNSKKAKDYYQALEQQERKREKKKPA